MMPAMLGGGLEIGVQEIFNFVGGLLINTYRQKIMSNHTEEIFDAITARVKSPLSGYYILATTFINWKPIFYVLISDDMLLERISYFDSHSSSNALVWYPILFSVVMAVTYPWINFAFLFLAKYPSYRFFGNFNAGILSFYAGEFRLEVRRWLN